MEKFKLINKLRDLYNNGENILEYLRKIENRDNNSIEDILISYDFQAGSYIKAYSENTDFKNKYCKALANIISKIDRAQSIIEVGVGEATTLGPLLRSLSVKIEKVFGFDISWSRLKFAQGLLKDFGFSNINLFTANLFEIPLPDNSIDIVYTSHSIEPNGGKEEPALKELFRITSKYLILLEPAYELADASARARMKHHGYVTELFSTVKKLGYNIIDYRLFEFSANPLNPTGLMIIRKDRVEHKNDPDFICPITKTVLSNDNMEVLYSKESFLLYPIISGIPCLLKENSILATHFLTSYIDFKNQHNIQSDLNNAL